MSVGKRKRQSIVSGDQCIEDVVRLDVARYHLVGGWRARHSFPGQTSILVGGRIRLMTAIIRCDVVRVTASFRFALGQPSQKHNHSNSSFFSLTHRSQRVSSPVDCRLHAMRGCIKDTPMQHLR